ncbi:MAG TPA: extracellular solute-binding protein [Clostridia bacterium]|nr:extracellular solute-binding protein [Clostridia bacterium]
MKKWIKTAALVLALTMLVSSFAACATTETPANSNVPETQVPDTQTPETQQPADEGLKGTLKLGIWPEDTKTDEIAMHEGYVKIFNELHPGVEVVPSYYKYATDTFVALAESGNLPTVFESWYTEPQKLIDQGLIADITDQVDAKGWTQWMNSDIYNLLSRDGRLYGIPRDAYTLGIMLNVELFEEAGLVDANGLPIYPKTWAELAETAKKIKDATGAAGLCLLAKDGAGGWHFSNIAWCFGATLESEVDGKWICNLNSPEVVAAMQYVYDLKWKYDVLTADPQAEDWGTGFQQLGTGGAAMYIAANDAVNMPTYVNGLAVDKLALIPIPAGPNGDQHSLMGGTPYFFSKDATPDEIAAALDYIEIMGKAPVTTDAGLAGIEADAKYRQENGIPVIPRFPAWNNPEYTAAENAANEKYLNVDMRLFSDYYAAVATEGNLMTEVPKNAQEMYAELTKVIQAVVTDKNADIQALLDIAQTNFQAILDEQVNKAS